MFLKFYSLQEQPFGVTPDPRFLFLSPSHKEALASLYCSIENNRGFSAMVAPPGMGKTSLLFRLLQSMDGKARFAFLFHPDSDAREFLASLTTDVGLECDKNDPAQMRESLNRMLIEERRAGRKFVVVIDEAQNLPTEVLESIRLLSNFETPQEKLLHIVLSGQPRLAETLERPELCQLRQRVATGIRLHPFSRQEVAEYIKHRLSIAGRNARSPFNDTAIAFIANESHGIPRNINSLCYQALSIGCAMRKAVIDSEVLKELSLDVGRQLQQQPKDSVLQANEPQVGDWSQYRLREETPIWAGYERKTRRWKPVTAIAATALLSTVFWTIAVPKIEMYRHSETFDQTLVTPNSPPSLQNQKANAQPAEASAPVVEAKQDPETEKAQNDSSASNSETITSEGSEEIKKAPLPNLARHRRIEKTRDNRNTRHQLFGTRVVFTTRKESLYQIALDNYGQSSASIVDRILIVNPKFANRDAIVSEGQRIVLPSLTTNADSKAANIKRD